MLTRAMATVGTLPGGGWNTHPARLHFCRRDFGCSIYCIVTAAASVSHASKKAQGRAKFKGTLALRRGSVSCMKRVIIALFILFSPLADVDAENRRMRIGIILPLSGALAEYGSAIRNGVEMARREHAELFEGVTFSYEDDQYDGKLALSAYRKLVAAEKIAILFAFGSIAGHALAPLAEQDKIIFLNIGFEPDPAVGKSFVLRSINFSEQYINALLQFLRGRNERSFVVINTELSFLNSMIAAFRKNLLSDEALEIASTVNPSETNFRALISKLKSKGQTSIGLFMLPEQISAFYKQAAQQRFEFTAYGTDFFETAVHLLPRGTMDRAVYPYNEVQSDFRNRYQKEFGGDAQITFAGNGYDMAMTFARSIREAGTLTAEGIMDKLREVKDAKGTLGTFSFVDSASFGKYYEYSVVVNKIVGERGVRASD